MISQDSFDSTLIHFIVKTNAIKILQLLNKEKKLRPEHIRIKLKLSYSLTRQIGLLCDAGFVKRIVKKDKEIYIEITKKGEEFYNIIKNTYDSLKELEKKYK